MIYHVYDNFGRVREKAEPEHPIFIFASGERCGSTFLQRLISSHCDVQIWGEQNGALESLANFWRTCLQHSSQYANDFDDYLVNGGESFIANLPVDGFMYTKMVYNGLKQTYGGFSERWGIKEVKCGWNSVKMLLDVFPECRIIFLTRDVRSCLKSLSRWNCDEVFISEFVSRWKNLLNDFLVIDGYESRTLLVKYEDLIRPESKVTSTICTFLNLDIAKLDLDLFNVVISDHSEKGGKELLKEHLMLDISDNYKKLVEDLEVKNLLDLLGYH